MLLKSTVAPEILTTLESEVFGAFSSPIKQQVSVVSHSSRQVANSVRSLEGVSKISAINSSSRSLPSKLSM